MSSFPRTRESSDEAAIFLLDSCFRRNDKTLPLIFDLGGYTYRKRNARLKNSR